LLKLLADDNVQIVETAKAKLIELGAEALPYLEQAAASHEDPAVRAQADKILRETRLTTLMKEWSGFSSQPDEQLDLEKGAFMLAKVTYPAFDYGAYQKRLDEIAEKVRPRLKTALKIRSRLRVLNDYLFRKEGYRGNWDDYFDPQNSFMNRVIDRKLGIPISLAVLYLLVARRLKLPVEGVGIPGHFMLKCEGEGKELYVDAFNEGRFLTRPECVQFIVEAGYPYQPEFMSGVGPREILARMLRNLILIYVDRQDEVLERTFTQFLSQLVPSEGVDDFSDDEDDEDDEELGGPSEGEGGEPAF
jgi:regulator of sirC expression with transglutaminase-like and TPR domain